MKRWCLLLSCLPIFGIGCDARIEHFDPNGVYALVVNHSLQTPTDAALQDIGDVLETTFGTPDEPRWPSQWLGGESLVDPERLGRAAGSVSSDKQGINLGLYRKHCVNCHGLSGSGAGPASRFQDPYPRDFRHGVFKWKSTSRAAKPTRNDLLQVLNHGVAGTGMPSFALLPAEDRDALVDYVIYLAVRGEVERRLFVSAVNELGYAETPPEAEWRLQSDSQQSGAGQSLLKETIEAVVESWQQAKEQQLEVSPPAELSGEKLAESIRRGEQWFHGSVANCKGCHGDGGSGQIVTLDFDDWTKEYSTRLGITPSDREAMKPFREAGALPPRQSNPRQLTDGVFRGGGDLATLYLRITQGIAGTPMPKVLLVDEGNGLGLSEEQVWDLARYVQSLAN